MKEITLVMQDEALPRVTEALCWLGNYPEKSLEMKPKPTKAEYAKMVLINFAKNAMSEYESRIQVEAVKQTAKESVDSVSIT